MDVSVSRSSSAKASRRFSASPALLLLAGLAAALLPGWPGVVGAATFDRGSDGLIDTPVDDDLYVAGGWLEIDTTIGEDLFAAGGTIEVHGNIGGDAVLVGGMVDLAAEVAEDAILAGGSVTISGPVAQDLVVAGGRIRVDRAALVGGGAQMAGGRVELVGEVAGDVAIVAGEVIVRGRIKGRLRVDAASLEITSSAVLEGEVFFRGVEPAVVHDGASLAHPIEEERFELAAGEEQAAKAKGGWPIGTFLAVLLTALVFWFLLPRYFEESARQLRRRPVSALAIGLAALFATPVLIVLAIISLIGLPLGLVLLGTLLVLGLLALALVPHALAAPLLARYGGAGENANSWRLGALVLGVVLVLALGEVPVIGGVVLLAVVLFGLGALLLGLRRLYDERAPQSIVGAQDRNAV